MATTDANDPVDRLAELLTQEEQAFDGARLWATIEARRGQAAQPTGAPARTHWWHRTALAAAGLVAVGIGAVAVQYRANHAPAAREYITSVGERLHVTLVDGTGVTLAPASRLTISSDYGLGTRVASLEGEAFFTVVHNAKHPFRVHAGTAVIQDVGTSFDIRSYPEDRATRVALVEGQAAVSLQGSSQDTHVLQRGDVALVSSVDITMQFGVNTSALASWTQGHLVFEATPLRDVVRDLDRTFGVTITVPDSALAAKLVTASFGSESMNETLDDLTHILGASYEQTGRTIVLRPRNAITQQLEHTGPRPLNTAQLK